MKPENIEDIYKLSPTQQGLLFHTLYAPNSGIYCDQYSITLKGDLNCLAFEQAWQQVAKRHSALRTSFFWEEVDEPMQVVHRQVNLPLEQHDWQGIEPVEQQQQLQTFLITDQKRGFELSQAPLMRLFLIQMAENVYQFIWSNHHLILDGWSRFVLFKEVLEIYQSLCTSKNLYLKPAFPYRKYIAWLRQQDLSQAETFWREALQGVTAPTPVVVDKSLSLTASAEEYSEQEIELSLTNTEQLKSLARQHQLTLNTLLQGAWALLLSRYSSEQDVVFGANTSGRPVNLPGVDSAIGLFVNTLPVRVKVNAEDSLIPWLKKLQAEQAQARQYEYSPLGQVQGWSEIPKGVPLFNSLIAFENYPVDSSLRQGNKNLEICDVSVVNRTNYPLLVIVVPGAELLLKIIYDRHLFDDATITRMLGHLQTLLAGMVANPEQRLKDLPLLTASEGHQSLVEWNNTQTEYPPNLCIHQLFAAQVEKTPDAIAVIFGDQQLTYQQLNIRANQLAHHLQKLGVQPEVQVGICTERSLEMVIGLLGILKAGGAYVPIDPEYPRSRQGFMLQDSQIEVLLTQEKFQQTLPDYQGKVICLDTDWAVIAQEQTNNPTTSTTTDNLAYIIYTSGSTGTPKGAMNTHTAVCNRLLWMQDTYQLTAADRILQKTPFSFDVSVWEFFWPLITGACLVIAQPGGHRDSGYLMQLILSEGITTLHFVPSMLRIFLEQPGLEQCNCLKRVFCSGEALPFDLQQRFFARLTAELHNLYGPTEAAIDVTAWACEPETTRQIVPIGSPIANIQIYLLDAYLNLVPVGIPGELHIGGVGLARGYFNRPELTAQKFIPDPFSNTGTRLYKTGDLARYLPNGEIEYLGRIDYQVKLRGLRIELGEIEAVLSQHPAIQQAVTMVREDELGNKRLLAYVVQNLQGQIEKSLPETALHAEQIFQWETVFNKTYNQTSGEEQPILNTVGWNSSYTDQPLPLEQMEEWISQTVRRIQLWQPKQVLEIGCGTGLLLFRIAPDCTEYWGTDFSAAVLDYIQQQLTLPELHLPQVKLDQRMADDFRGMSAAAFNAVVLNSVVQYFPDINYLLDVLKGAVRAVAPGGYIFVGDVRSLPLLEAFHTSVQLYQSSSSLSTTQLKQRIQKRIAQEQELLIDPTFFIALKQHLPQIAHVQIQIKRGHHANEMTKFRYDVTLHIQKLEDISVGEIDEIQQCPWLDWQQSGLTLNAVCQLLATTEPEILGLRGVPNSRVFTEVKTLELLANNDQLNHVGELREALAAIAPDASIDPEEFWSLSDRLPYAIDIQWSNSDADGNYDVVFQKCQTKAPKIIPLLQEQAVDLKPWSTYANNPLQGKLASELVPQLRGYLEEKLPDYMIPSTFVVLKNLPLTSNGKVDRKALPDPGIGHPDLQKSFVAPHTPVEATLAKIWAKVLGVEQVGIHDNFFELGGDSILSIQVIAKANQADIKLTPKQLFDYQTIAELAKVAGTTLFNQIEQGIVTGSVPLTPIQHWFFQQEQPDPHHWNQALLLLVRQPLDPALLKTSVQELLIHHDALRLRFERTTSGWQQFNAPPDEIVPFVSINLSALPKSEQASAMEATATELQASLDLAKEIMRVALFNLGADQPSRLLIIVHHLAIDGISWRILLEDLQTVYQQLHLPAKTTSFQQWSNCLQNYAQSTQLKPELDYWLTTLQQPVVSMPVDDADGANTVASADTVSISLTVAETQALLQQVPKVYNTQINDVLLTALVQAFGQWTGEYSLLVDLEGHGREDIFADLNLSRTVGWFTSLFPVHLHLAGVSQPGEALKIVKEQLRQIPHHGIGYGVLRYLSNDQEIPTQLRSLPQAQVLFNYLGQFDTTLSELSLFELASESSGTPRSLKGHRHHLLIVNGLITQGQLQLTWMYSQAVHRPATIENLAQSFVSALRSLITHCQSQEVGGYTPSDFPLVKLDQSTLDRLIASSRPIADIYPLSPIQQGLLFHTLYAPASQMYFEQWSCTLHGNLHLQALEKAWQQAIDRHAVLRTGFYWENLHESVQVVCQQVELPWQQYDWRGLSSIEQADRFEAFLSSDRQSGFTLAIAPLMRLTLIQIAENRYHFIWSHHHLLMDGWAAASLLKEVFDSYQAFSQGQEIALEPTRTYRNYISWLQQQDMVPAEAFWRRMLQGFTTSTAVLPKYPTSGQDQGYKLQEIQVSTATSTALQSLSRQSQITLNSLVQGIWALLLSHHSGELDVVFGATVSGRPATLVGSESMVGLFINTLPVRVQIARDEFFLNWLKKLQNQQVEARQYEHSPLVQIHKFSEIPQNLPLFESIVVFQNYPLAPSLRQGTTNLKLSNVRASVSRNNYPLTVRVRIDAEWSWQILYDCCRFETTTIDHILKQIEMVLNQIITQQNIKLSELLELLTVNEQQHNLHQEKEIEKSNLQKLKMAKRKANIRKE